MQICRFSIFLTLLFFFANAKNYLAASHVKDTLADSTIIESTSNQLLSPLQELLHLEFFRYFKISLQKKCPFWEDDSRCVNEACSLTVTEEEKISQTWNNQDLGAVEKKSFRKSSPFYEKCDYTEKDFCILEDLSSTDGVYIDLVQNPERFTGYSGDSARRVWQSIYEQNCFKFVFNQSSPQNVLINAESALETQCVEKRAFYRVVSGMHASISIQLCRQMLDKKTGEWYPDHKCFEQRVGNHPERMENLYFLYSLILQAVQRLEPYLQKYPYCSGSEMEQLRTRWYLDEITSKIVSRGPFVNIDKMFTDRSLKEEFKRHFRNISRIMDCVGCEKCKLWGKIQTLGIGTALKVLFSYDHNSIDSSSFQLRPDEVVALFNALGRYGESIHYIGLYRTEINTLFNKNELMTTLYNNRYVIVFLFAILTLGISSYRYGLHHRKSSYRNKLKQK